MPPERFIGKPMTFFRSSLPPKQSAQQYQFLNGMEEETPTSYTSMEMDGNTYEKEVDNTINVVEKLEEPKFGMMIITVDKIIEYYIRYGNDLGFPIKRRTSSKRDDGELRYMSFASFG
ncbi:unnamed protein product [Ilex paraguariensis]|uniref:Uncharacterized protein n=1 Tax=Ilex paraguariensis TaxID=185542 RepID=A0ABC8SD14_9AQUA